MLLILHASQVSNTLHSSRSPALSHKSLSGPSPHHHTRYCMPFLCLRSSTIFSMKNSWALSGLRGCRAWLGNVELLFSSKGFTSEVWKMGKDLEWFGKASVTMKCISSVKMIG